MKPVITILSDIGRVVVDFDNRKAARAFSRHSPMAEAEIHYRLFVDDSSPCAAFDRGLLEPDEFRLRVGGLLQLNDRLTDEEFDEAFSDIFTLITPVAELWQKLRRRGVPVFALSNVDAIRFQYAIDRIEHEGSFFQQLFDGLILSYEERLAKPDPEIFIRALDRAGSKAEETLFVDDIPGYAEVARKLGIRAHVQTPWDLDGLVAFLKANGLGEHFQEN